MIDKSLFRHFKAYIGLSLSVAMALLVLQIMDAKGVYHECVVAGVSEHFLSTIQLTNLFIRVLYGPDFQS